jgi:hypothetical protein
MRRREKSRKKEVEASIKSSVLCVWKNLKKSSYNIVNIIIAVAELKNTDFRWSKRDGPLWAVHIKKRKTEKQKDRKTERQKDRKTERQKDRETERQRNRKTERQKDRKTDQKAEKSDRKQDREEDINTER